MTAFGAEVIIIGAGAIGCSIAYNLSHRGCKDVIVLERDSVGSGSTGRCAGGIRQQFSTETNIKLSMESVRFFEHFEDLTGHAADFRQYGYLMLATSEESVSLFRSNVALQRKLGVKVEFLSSSEVVKLVPQLNTGDVLGATFCPTDGYADPYSVVQGFASAAKRNGAKIVEGVEVTGISVVGGKVRSVATTAGEFRARVVINAAGPWARLVGRMAGVDIPVRPSRRHIFVTSPVGAVRRDLPMVVEFDNGFWLRREGPALIFGMRNPDEPEGFDISVDWGFLNGLLGKVASHRFPLLQDTGVVRAQGGLHEDSPDDNAILGPVDGVEGFYIACGFSGHGFMHSPAAGRLMAELILGKQVDRSM
ncbi:MAG: FAD-binding oxidoreductase, partial [Dehalococcoidia bacterium]|nr:FAD-binding oxidoreductase [Dehalococcoidia bacterium]